MTYQRYPGLSKRRAGRAPGAQRERERGGQWRLWALSRFTFMVVKACKMLQDQKSKTLEGGGSNPVWNQSFFFKVDDDNTNVIIKIFDEDKNSADDAIGETKISLVKVLDELKVPARSYDLVLPNGDKHGHVEVSLKFVPTAKKPQPPPVFHPDGPHHHHAHHHDQPHHSGNGPYGDSSEGGWQ